MARIPQEEPKPGAPEWVVTFGDMMSLLLVFFVLLLSFSTMEAEKFKVVAGFMRQAFGLQTKINYTGVPMGTTVLSTDSRESMMPTREIDLLAEVKELMSQAGLGERGSARFTDKGVALRLEGETVFDSGEAQIRGDAEAVLNEIAAVVSARQGVVEIEGHSDDRPISNDRYPSNWELSTARAGAVARYLVRRGVPPDHIRAIGYADTRPLAPNDTSANRAKNRRVEIVFISQNAEDRPPGPVAADPDPVRTAPGTRAEWER